MIDDILFSKSFAFNVYHFLYDRHNNIEKGVHQHFLAYILSGNGRIVGQHRTLELSKGDIFYIPKGCCYHSYWVAHPDVKFISLGFTYFPVFSESPLSLQKLPDSKQARSLFEKIAKMREASCESIGMLYTLLGILYPYMQKEKLDKQTQLVELAKIHLQKDPSITIDELAKECASSPSALYLAFRNRSTITMNEYRNRVLMEKAKEMLISTDRPIEAISEDLGFSSSSYFRKKFKEIFHTTPRKMRTKYGI